MKFIAHRGNIYGNSDKSKENTVYQAEEAINKKYDVELDIWYWNSKWWLGHDYPHNEVDYSFLTEYWKKLWLHCKDVDTFTILLQVSTPNLEFNCFMHDQDLVAYTNRGFLWTYNNGKLRYDSIAVMPEHPCNNWSIEDISKCYGICTDQPYQWRELLNKERIVK